MSTERIDYVEVEISVYKPTGYSIRYLVEGTPDRWKAVLAAVEEFEKQDSTGMMCLNMIWSSLSDPKPNDKRVRIKCKT